MKKNLFLCTVLCVLYSLNTFAQNGTDKKSVRWGIVAGLNGYDAGDMNLSDNRGRLGGELGVKVELPLSLKASHWYLETEAKLRLLRWHETGVTYVTRDPDDESKKAIARSSFTRDAYYLNIPIHIGRKGSFGENLSLFFDAGPYIAYGLFGKSKYIDAYHKIDNQVVHRTYSYNTFDRSRRFEWGVGVKLGAELYKHYQVGVSYDYGVTRAHDSDRNANFTFVVGYMF